MLFGVQFIALGKVSYIFIEEILNHPKQFQKRVTERTKSTYTLRDNLLSQLVAKQITLRLRNAISPVNNIDI